MTSPLRSLLARGGASALALAAVLAACAQGGEGAAPDGASAGSAGQGGSGGQAGSISVADGGGLPCPEACGPAETCLAGRCVNACEARATVDDGTSVGCDYYAVDLDSIEAAREGCFAVIVANPSDGPARLFASFDGSPIDLGAHARIPSGSGAQTSYGPFDPAKGLGPGEAAVLFLAGDPDPAPGPASAVKCPVPAALSSAQRHGTGRGRAFHLQADSPVVAYQMLPYGGGAAAVTGATLLLPTRVWGKNYLAVSAYDEPAGPGGSLTIVAMADETTVTLRPSKPVLAGGGIAAVPAGAAASYKLAQGETLQIVQPEGLSGSPIESDKPVGLFSGHLCATIPAGSKVACDHLEAQIPPIKALGHAYAAAANAPRTDLPEPHIYRLMGAVDGTQLSFDPSIDNAPAALAAGEVVELRADQPFTVKSQDDAHPFLLLAYMTSCSEVGGKEGGKTCSGDPDMLRVAPPPQYLSRYVFFTDPTYPETDLVVVRQKGATGFDDVELDCAGVIGGWQPIGQAGDFEVAHVPLVHDFLPQGGCDNGRHEAHSDSPFGLWVWGWGSPRTQGPGVDCDPSKPGYTCAVSYAVAAGERVASINGVIVPVVK